MAQSTGEEKGTTSGTTSGNYAGVSGKKAADSGYRIQNVSDYKPIPGGYQNIAFIPFILGASIVAIPIQIFNQTKREWVYPYITLITLMLVIFWWSGFSRFSVFVNDMREKVKG